MAARPNTIYSFFNQTTGRELMEGDKAHAVVSLSQFLTRWE